MFAQNPPEVKPSTSTPLFCVGENATVSIALNNVSNLYGYQLKVNYSNPALVSAVGAFDNSFFDTDNDGAVPPLWNGACAAGVCPFAKSEQGDPAVSGSGTVATVDVHRPSGWRVRRDHHRGYPIR